MKRILGLIVLLCSSAQAGLITHTDYVPGAVVTSAGQNTNENTIVNEFNGNIESANIKDGTIANADIADGVVSVSKLQATAQSTFTFVNLMGAYRRPVLFWINVTSVDVEANTGIANKTCIMFSNEQRCVTEDTSSTNVNRRFIITAVANFTSGTEDSGLIGATEAINTWYAIYAVKSQINSANFVLVGTTVTPHSVTGNVATTGGNFTVLNNMFGKDAWVYLGMVANGDNSGATGDIKNFVQVGNLTMMDQSATTGSVALGTGIRLATTASATSLTWSFYKSTTTAAVPNSATAYIFLVATTAGANVGTLISDATGAIGMATMSGSGNSEDHIRFMSVCTSGIKLLPGSTSPAMDIFLVGFYDAVLGIGAGPQL